MSVQLVAGSVRARHRAARAAGMAAAALLAVLTARFGAVLGADEQWLAVHYSPPKTTAEVTRLLVGVPVCVVAVFLLADRSGHRAGVLPLAAGAVWILPSSMFDLFSAYGGGSGAAGAVTIVLGAVGVAGRPLTVLLLVLCLLRDPPPRRWHRGLAAVAAVAYAGNAALWALGVPGSPPLVSPWSETAAGEWAAGLLDLSQEVLWWVSSAVVTGVAAELARRAVRAPSGRDRRVGVLLAAAYPVCAFLLLADVGGAVPTVAARAVGSTVWIAVICLTVARTDMWRLERATCHRLAGTFVLTILLAVGVCVAVLVYAAFPYEHDVPAYITAGGAFLAGWLARPVMRRTSLAVERAFYGPRARPHEAARALAVRLRMAPQPGDVPEQICRTVVEDLGLSGAVVEVDTRSGPRRLAAFGAPVGEPRQVFVLRHHGKVTGRLMVSRDGASTPTERDTDLLSLLADQAGPALAALRLGEEAQAARERLVLAREEERRRLRREIHDGLGPQLAAVQLRLGVVQARGVADAAASEQLRLASDVLGEALTELRRITAGLTPAALVEHGLLVAARTLAHRLSTDSVRVTVACADCPLPAMPPAVETAAYRITAEAVTNAVRHARAEHVRVDFAPCPGGLTVTVADDGTGFDSDAVAGTGLASIAERAEEIGGTYRIDSGPHGTTTRATLPIRPSIDQGDDADSSTGNDTTTDPALPIGPNTDQGGDPAPAGIDTVVESGMGLSPSPVVGPSGDGLVRAGTGAEVDAGGDPGVDATAVPAGGPGSRPAARSGESQAESPESG